MVICFHVYTLSPKILIALSTESLCSNGPHFYLLIGYTKTCLLTWSRKTRFISVHENKLEQDLQILLLKNTKNNKNTVQASLQCECRLTCCTTFQITLEQIKGPLILSRCFIE